MSRSSARSHAMSRNFCLQASGKLVLFLRDVNLPKADKYGTSQVMAFLQQLLTYQGFYKQLEFIGRCSSKILPKTSDESQHKEAHTRLHVMSCCT